MKKISQGFCLFVLFGLVFTIITSYASAAGLNYIVDTNVVLGAKNYTIKAGSTAETVSSADATVLTVTLVAGESFTFSSPNGFGLVTSPIVFTQTCGNGANSVTLSTAGTFIITPNPTQQCVTGSEGRGAFVVVIPPVAPTISTVIRPAQCPTGELINTGTGLCQISTIPIPKPGCGNSNIGFSTLSGQSCAGTTTTINTSLAVIAGCGTSNIGFSTVTGQSCSNNLLLTPVPPTPAPVPRPIPIVGCGNSTSGFSAVTGVSCANESVSGVNHFSDVGDSYNFGNVTLRNGSSGIGVMDLQTFLNKFNGAGLGADGKMGPRTVSEVIRWQSGHNLTADGSVGPKTMAEMHSWAATH
jgi:hypothetical protein